MVAHGSSEHFQGRASFFVLKDFSKKFCTKDVAENFASRYQFVFFPSGECGTQKWAQSQKKLVLKRKKTTLKLE